MRTDCSGAISAAAGAGREVEERKPNLKPPITPACAPGWGKECVGVSGGRVTCVSAVFVACGGRCGEMDVARARGGVCQCPGRSGTNRQRRQEGPRLAGASLGRGAGAWRGGRSRVRDQLMCAGSPLLRCAVLCGAGRTAAVLLRLPRRRLLRRRLRRHLSPELLLCLLTRRLVPLLPRRLRARRTRLRARPPRLPHGVGAHEDATPIRVGAHEDATRDTRRAWSCHLMLPPRRLCLLLRRRRLRRRRRLVVRGCLLRKLRLHLPPRRVGGFARRV